MEEDFVVLTDRNPEFIAPLGFEPAFSLTLEYAPEVKYQSPRGNRIFREITGGSVSGRIAGTAYPDGAGEYSLQREDGVTDLNAHILLQDEKGEYLYVHNQGYRRPDGYYRVTSWVDSDVRGAHDWTIGLFFIGVGKPAQDGRSITIDYYEVA